MTPLNDLDLSVRAYNCLKAADVKSLGDLVRLEISDMMKFRNFGKKSLAELEQLVQDKNLTFGMDLSKYKLRKKKLLKLKKRKKSLKMMLIILKRKKLTNKIESNCTYKKGVRFFSNPLFLFLQSNNTKG